MIDSIDIQTALWVVCIVNVSFAVGLLLLRTDRVWDGARLWIVGNLFGLGAATLRLSFEEGLSSPVESILPATLMSLTNLFKIAALVRRRERLRVALAGAALMMFQLICALLDDISDNLNLAFASVGLSLSFLLGWQAWICFAEPRWKRLRGRNLFVASTALIAVFSAIAALRGLGVQAGGVIFSERGPAQINLITALTYIIISHICLISMLTDRLNRIIAVSNLRQRKESRLARQAEAHAREMASLAREKQSLLEVLIHEVRQPLNNAQAALQHAMMTVDLDSSDGANGRRLQAIIDKIVLSLTNAIVGASVLERKSESRLVKTDIGSICELASGDAGLDWEDQIDLVSPLAPVYAEADPVLLRLAVRNLIDNAIKHSAPGRKTGVTIEHAAASGEIEIRVVNWPAEAFTPDRQLFERGVRGSNALSDGRGLGLYIAREIALLHHGSVQAHTNAHGQTEFVLAIRA